MTSRRSKNQLFWDGRAADMPAHGSNSSYESGFIAAMELRPGETVLDVGSGAGTLALPLARAGHVVYAVDFSEGMLQELSRRAAEQALRTIVTVQASWGDDWRAAGVRETDVAVASRSLDVPDLQAALRKLHGFARRRVCVTLPADGLFYPDVLAQRTVGRRPERRADHTGAVAILRSDGIEPEVRMLTHESSRDFESLADARAFLQRVVAPRDEREIAALEHYIATHLVATATGDEHTVWMHDEPVVVRWALLAWNTTSGLRSSTCQALGTQ